MIILLSELGAAVRQIEFPIPDQAIGLMAKLEVWHRIISRKKLNESIFTFILISFMLEEQRCTKNRNRQAY